VAVVTADALADLQPLAANVRVGGWVDVRAKLLVPFAGAKVIVLGPRGAPRPLPTAVGGGQVSASFSADQEGAWLVQVVADVQGGPRQVLEALLIAGDGPRRQARDEAPGERERTTADDSAGLLFEMLAAARSSEQRSRLRRDPELDRIAREQAAAARAAGHIAHDLGSGDPEARVRAAGIDAESVGENLARAESIARAHRALWSSPSHRTNILDDRFDSIGIGVVEDADGVWACELFARMAP
jgi:uncharacterized protein YkwD